ncbi:MAG: 30S ribosomal protein S3ae [Methanomassiliicoccales archaeon]|nr:30S ribosomal protein S3ae [Methanomassiliicoccales archaeon]
MAAAKKVKSTSRKIKDKWKAKEWYKIHAPRMFNEVEIGETPAIDVETIYGRTVDVTVQELTGDFSKQHIKMRFQITGVDGHDAKTSFIGHELTSDYVRRLTRRKKTKTDHVVDVETKDGYVLRIKTMSIADKRIQSSQEEGMRRCIADTLVAIGKENDLSNIIKLIISGEMGRNVAKACHVIIPIKRIEIRKSEVLSAGEGEPESIMDIFAKPEAEEAPAAEAVEAPAEVPAEEPAEEPAAEAPAEE